MNVCQTADGSLTLQDPHSGQTYRSIHGAVAESTLVFLQNSNVARRLIAGMPTQVLEIGFGTGLNFCISAAHANAQRCQLHYTAYEFALPPVAMIEHLLRHNLPGSQQLISELIALLHKPGPTKRKFGQLHELIELDLQLLDARLANWSDHSFDAIYLDAFSTRCNAQLWQQSFLAQLKPALRAHGRLVTFGVNRAFRQALEFAGFDWEKRPGPAGKREVLVAWCRR